MKKFMLLVCLAILPAVSQAQERVSLFDDTPPPPPAETQEGASAEAQKSAEQAPKQARGSESESVGLPRLGRQAEPLSTLIVEPISGFTFGVDLDGKEYQEQQKEQAPAEPLTPESDLIRRSESLTFVETGDRTIQTLPGGGVNIADLRRHDVSKFKLAGIRFGDDGATVYETLIDLGYSLQKIEKSIPRYRTSHYNDICRNERGIKILADIRRCVLELAEADELHYVFRETYTRPETNETVQVTYSTPDTDNLVYKVVYENRGDTSLNSSPINLAKKFQRRDDFWDLVFKVYGLPDDSDNKVWGNYNTRYLKAVMYGSAYHAYLIMEDRIMQDKEYEAAQEDYKTLRKNTPFTFAGEVPENDED